MQFELMMITRELGQQLQNITDELRNLERFYSFYVNLSIINL